MERFKCSFQDRIESTKGIDIFEQLKKMKESIAENIEKQNKLLEESKTANELAPVLWSYKYNLKIFQNDQSYFDF